MTGDEDIVILLFGILVNVKRMDFVL